MHFPASKNLIFADNGNIVFCLARHDASTTSGAFAQIYGHGPLVTTVLQCVLFPLRKPVHNMRSVLGEARVLLVLVDVCFAENGGQPFRDSHVPAGININGVVVLSRRQGIVP